MDANNLVVIRGVVVNEPRIRELPAGVVVTQLDVTTRSEGLTASVPVSVYGRTVDAAAGDVVVVAGHVNRRFFRAGGTTQSRTELVADDVVRTSRKRAVEKMIASVIDLLAA
jgi:single-strand DNA-binding protein